MTTEETKLEILKKVENGTLTIEEGADLLGIIEKSHEQQEPSTESQKPEILDAQPSKKPKSKPDATGCMKAFLSLVVVIGAILTAFSVYWVYQGYKQAGLGWGFWLSWIPLLIGIFIIILGWALMESPWIHIVVHLKDSGKQADLDVSAPIPFNLAKWAVKSFRNFMPEKYRDIDFAGVIDQAEESVKNGEPYEVQVDEKDGTKVIININ